MKEHIDKMTDEALESVEGAKRATPRPYLFTRLVARIEKGKESAWENAGRFIARPVVVVAGLCAIIAVNALVIAFNNSTPAAATSVAEQTAMQDEFSTSIASLYDIENTEP